MKRILTSILICLGAGLLSAQTINDFGRIVLRSDVTSVEKLTAEAKSVLLTKLNQITTNCGVAATEINPRFVITAKVDVVSKDIVPGPPQMISQKLQITFFVGDAMEQKLFGNYALTLIGIGINETKAAISAIGKINPDNQNIKAMVEECKSKIVTWYAQSCEMILNDARSLSSRGEYSRALYSLALVPDICYACYQKAQKMMNEVYTAKTESEGMSAFAKAQSLWAQSPNRDGAREVMQYIAKISPAVSFRDSLQSFIKRVTASVQAQDLREWEQQVKEYNDRLEEAKLQNERNHQLEQERIQASRDIAERNQQLEQERIRACRDVAMEYYRNQPKTVNVYRTLIIR